MKPLSQVLENTALMSQDTNQNISNTPAHGLTADAGKTNIQLRDLPLTEKQLLSICSKMQHAPLVISSKQEKIYGRKKFIDEYGEYYCDNEPTGIECVFYVQENWHKDIDLKILESAHRRSPVSAYILHLSRLSVHKIMGTGGEDKTILLHDYAVALSIYPEFIVWLACKWFWENDPNKFFPKIAEIKRLCEAIKLPTIQHPRIEQRKEPEYYHHQKDNPIRKTLCDFIKDKGGEDLFEMTQFYSNYQLEIMAKSKYGWAA